MWRQGDVFIESVTRVPATATHVSHGVLVEGEATGHSHRLEDLSTAEVFQKDDDLFVRVLAHSARIVHEEHNPIALPRGIYRVWKQREYTPETAPRFGPGTFGQRWVRD
jgi:hypothetical protein